ncbi:HAD family hydrolase [Alkalihalobacillus pseudalcaliphilus]|uniref:HAD family hydrolase n=1 Tax=Alkalihalobacillus pseudalcaliphilus TaxID=79884 RepID=UPI00064D8E79|nr:HAD family hydrolase [Alkalihalobacillus pseudalcaliphilus]KMK77024.1 HAD family hydrolase [Alkalihalobacillus pseudalcaliphilus]
MDSLIFDLDGTLWDSRESVVKVWNQVLTENGINKKTTLDDFTKTMGLQVEEIGEILLPELTKEKRHDILEQCNQAENEYLQKNGGILYEQVEEVLKELKQHYRLFIVSNCQDGYIEAFLDYYQLHHFFIDYENPGRTGLSKGENIKLIMKRNQLVSPIYIGDTTGDQAASEFAGIPFYYAAYGFGEVGDYTHKLKRFSDLLALKK